MGIEKFVVQNNSFVFKSVDDSVNEIKHTINSLGLSFTSHNKVSFTRDDIDSLLSKINETMRTIDGKIQYYRNNSNSDIFYYASDQEKYGHSFQPVRYFQGLKKLLEGHKPMVERNYMNAIAGDIPNVVHEKRLSINAYVDSYSSSEVEALENALEYMDEELERIDGDWDNVSGYRNMASLVSNRESIKVIKREIKNRIVEAKKVEAELERVERQIERQIEQQHINRMQEMEMERQIEEIRLKRQREAQRDMDDLMQNFRDIIMGVGV